jgi:hypothetical protein
MYCGKDNEDYFVFEYDLMAFHFFLLQGSFFCKRAVDLGNRVRPSVLTRVLDLRMKVSHWYKIDTETLKKYLQMMGKLGHVD